MKKLMWIFLVSFPSIIFTSVSLKEPITTKVKIVNPRKQKLIIGELQRTLEHSTAALTRYRKQTQLNKELPSRHRTSCNYAEIQKHLAAYKTLKKIYDEYLSTQQLSIPREFLTLLIHDKDALSMLIMEAAQEEEMHHILDTDSLRF